MAKQTFTTGQVLTAAQMTDLQQTAMTGGAASTKTVSYVLVAADAGTRVAMNAAGFTTITVNTALFSAGDTVSIQNIGAGVCTVTAGTATVNTSGSLVLAQYQGGILYFTSTSTAIFFQFATPESGDISGVTAGTGISGGGTSGTVTITNSMATEITAKADLIVGTGNAAFDNLPVGANGTVLTADSTVSPTGLKWAAVTAGGGKVLQVVQATKLDSTTTSSQAFVAAGLQVTITPSSASSKVLILSSFTLTGSSSTQPYYKLVRNTSTDIFIGDAAGSRPRVSGGTFIDNSNYITNGNVMFLDSPATTSATTYDIYIRAGEAATIGFNRSVTDQNTADYGARAAASIIALEIGA